MVNHTEFRLTIVPAVVSGSITNDHLIRTNYVTWDREFDRAYFSIFPNIQWLFIKFSVFMVPSLNSRFVLDNKWTSMIGGSRGRHLRGELKQASMRTIYQIVKSNTDVGSQVGSLVGSKTFVGS